VGRRKHHHYVPAGYQRAWAVGERIRYVRKDGTVDKPISVRDAFVARDLNTVRDREGRALHDRLETEWRRLENDCLPAMRRLARGDRSPDLELEVKVLMAMLFARSRWHQRRHDEIAEEVTADQRRVMARSRTIRAQFRRDFGHRPSTAELETLVDQAMADQLRTQLPHVESMVRHYRWCLERFQDASIQVAHALTTSHAFIFSDTPVIVGAGEVFGSVLTNLAIGDATFLAMPISPSVYVSLDHAAGGWGYISSPQVRWLNETMWCNAQEAVAMHPGMPWHLSPAAG
jgi:hypothetical protein